MQFTHILGAAFSFSKVSSISDVWESRDGDMYFSMFLVDRQDSIDFTARRGGVNIAALTTLHAALMDAYLDDNSPSGFRIFPGFRLELGTPKEIKLPGDFEDAMDGLLGQLRPPAVLVPGDAQGSTNAPPGDWQASIQLLMRDVDDQIRFRPDHQGGEDVQALLEAIRVEIPSIAVRVLGPTPTETGRIN
jgi:hypothetical protein